jgi:hypothetical protein
VAVGSVLKIPPLFGRRRGDRHPATDEIPAVSLVSDGTQNVVEDLFGELELPGFNVIFGQRLVLLRA